MASNPIMRQRLREIEAVGEEDIFGKLEQGWTTNKVVEQHLKVGKRAFYKWLRAVEGREERYYDARRKWANHLAEETLEIADNVVDAADAQVAKLRIDTRKWMAAKANPDNWGDRKDPLVNINIQDQHLSALRDIMREHNIVVDQ